MGVPVAMDVIRRVGQADAEAADQALELGMEAVWRIEVRDFPAFIVVDDKGNDFFADGSGPAAPLLTIGSAPGH